MGLFQNIGNWWNDITGTTDRQQGRAQTQAAASAAQSAQRQAGQWAGQLAGEAQTARQRTAADLGTSAADYMNKAQAAAQGTAAQGAQQAAQQSIKAARTAGATGGQAALAAAQNTGQAYQQGVQAGVNQYGQATQMGQNQAQMLGTQQATQQQLQQGATSTQANVGQGQQQAGQQQGQALWSGISDVAKTAAMMSDENTKKDITYSGLSDLFKDSESRFKSRASEIDELLSKVKPVDFNYKGESSGTPKHAGVIAQDLEQVKPEAIIENPEGLKMIDTEQVKPLLLDLAKRLAGADGEQPNISSDAELQTTLLNYLLRAANKGGM